MITVSSLFCCFAPGKDKPRVSTTDDMVFAVNIPPKQQRQIKTKSLLSSTLAHDETKNPMKLALHIL